MNELVAYLGNFTVVGVNMTKQADGRLLRDSIPMDIEGCRIVIQQRPEVVQEYLKKQPRGFFVDSSEVTVASVAEADIEHILEEIDLVCDLFSFATESRVCRYGHDYPKGQMAQRRSVIGRVQYWRPPFYSTEDIKTFVESCFDSYRLLREKRQLHVVIDYVYHCVMDGMATEAKIALSFVCLENLRHTFVLSKPFANGRPARKKYLFDDLTEMFSAIGMTPDIRRLVDVRNEMIHEGVLSTSHDYNWETFELCQSCIREYLLRLLGYRGVFMSYDLTHSSC